MTSVTSSTSLPQTARSLSDALGGRVFLVACFAVPLLIDAFGQAPYYGLTQRLYPWTTIGALCIAGFLLLMLFVTPDRQIFREVGGPWGRRAIMLLCLLTVPFGFRLLGGTPSLPVLIFFGVLFLIYLGIVIWNPRTMLVFFGLVLVYGTVMRLRYMNAFPVFSGLADMLPLIVKASERFLAGQQPYVELYSMPYIVPLPYLPVMWLSYVPAVALGVDIRMVNLLCEAGIVLLFLSLVFPLRRQQETNVAVGYAAFLFMLPTSLFYDSFTSHQVTWFWFLLALRVLLARRILLSGIAFGITLAASQMALVGIPIIGVYIWRAFGFKKIIGWGLAAFVVAALFVVPFALWNPRQFYEYVVLFFSDLELATEQWTRDQRWLFILGFTAEAWRMGFQGVLKFIQGILVLLLTGVFAFKYPATPVNLLRFVILSFAFFILFSPIVALYYPLIWLLVLGFYLAVLGNSSNSRAVSTESAMLDTRE